MTEAPDDLSDEELQAIIAQLESDDARQEILDGRKSNQPSLSPPQSGRVAPKQIISLPTVRRRGVKWAPVCFGSPYYFIPAHEDCQNCEFHDRCAGRTALEAKKLVGALPALSTHQASLRDHIRGYYLRKSRNSRRRSRSTDGAYRVRRRAKANDEAVSIEKEFRARLRALKRAVANPKRDKLLQQLRGRELDVVRAWKARRLAQIEHGLSVSDPKVALVHRTLFKSAHPYSSDRARNDRRLVRELESVGKVWDRF